MAADTQIDHSASRGVHVLLDLFGCTSAILADEIGLAALAVEAAEAAGATVLAEHHHRFEPHGVSAVCILAESHLSIHTWPEIGTATIDVYTCGDKADPEIACNVIAERLMPRSLQRQRIERGFPNEYAS